MHHALRGSKDRARERTQQSGAKRFPVLPENHPLPEVQKPLPPFDQGNNLPRFSVPLLLDSRLRSRFAQASIFDEKPVLHAAFVVKTVSNYVEEPRIILLPFSEKRIRDKVSKLNKPRSFAIQENRDFT